MSGFPDATALSELVGAIYECTIDPKNWLGVLTKIEAQIGAACSYLIIHDVKPGTRGFGKIVMHNISDEADRGYNEHYAKLNPLLPYLTSNPSGEVYATRHLVSDESYLNAPFYNEYAKPLDWFDYAGVTLHRGGENASVIGFTSHGEGRAFSDDAIALLELLSPHLTRATRIERHFMRERLLARNLAAILGATRMGVLVVDRMARVLFANATAEALLARRDGISYTNGAVAAGQATRALHAAIEAATRHHGVPKAGVTVRVEREQGRRPHALYVLPLPRETDAASGFTPSTSAIVLIADPEQRFAGMIDVFGELYGLTSIERHVLTMLEGGATPQAIAAALNIAVSTVRSHLHNMFVKTGTSGQSELLTLVHHSVPPLR